ncbi:helix-turn-helix domain-containing protein [Herbiconiux sp. CPCC 203407]|uniref:Helix-turn-helix domain-containing protein n=1 Tax=Herbiconiux oxytropis TaxID=2970915 RepID=A0AA41XC21_9MICO|nr:ArsR family transcriptional regulator [Herbiconiux oxytropis]MCS5723917.1 helix-turn-helix domain-containing protein [Herbiconiux oxytropis]MCS5725427.1 helix-turn-helix domain-containing protein [Herbiconiux oxytropis]
MSELKRRVAVFAALADPSRLQIIDLLTLGDLAPSEIELLLGLRSNLVAHHLRVLEEAQIVSRTRSESDKRRSYLSLQPEVFDTLTPVHVAVPKRVVFVCTANSARSQLAETIWREASEIPAASAGTHPGAAVNPGAVAVAERHGLRIDRHARPLAVEEVLLERDLVVTVCDSAHERMTGRDDLHWSIPDPARSGTPEAFERAFDLISRRIRALTSRLRSV